MERKFTTKEQIDIYVLIPCKGPAGERAIELRMPFSAEFLNQVETDHSVAAGLGLEMIRCYFAHLEKNGGQPA